MNHIGPPQPSLRAERSSVTPTGSTLSVPEGSIHRQKHGEPGDRRSLQLSVDVDDISRSEVGGERLADAAVPANDGGSPTDKPADGSDSTDQQPHLVSRPSLRLRRNFECPDLVIINRNPSAEDVATACTSRAVPAPPPQPQRQPPPSFSSSSSTSPSSMFVSRLPRRRLTMPGIIKYDPSDHGHRRPGSSRSISRTPSEPLPDEYTATISTVVDNHSTTPPTGDISPVDAGFGVRGGRPATEMFLVENCTRKRVQEEQMNEAEVKAAVESQQTTAVESILDTPSLDGLDPPKPLTTRYRVQPGNLNRRSGRSDLGSLPDLSAVRHLPVLAPIPRNEAMLLCYKKREELQLLHEQEEHIRRRTFVLRLGDFKAWCVRRQLVLFVLALNIALAVTFYKLLYE